METIWQFITLHINELGASYKVWEAGVFLYISELPRIIQIILMLIAGRYLLMLIGILIGLPAFFARIGIYFIAGFIYRLIAIAFASLWRSLRSVVKVKRTNKLNQSLDRKNL